MGLVLARSMSTTSAQRSASTSLLVFQFSGTVEFQGFVAFLSFVRITRKAAKPGLFPAGPQTFGENLKQRRLELGLRQQDVAVRIGVSEWTVINWEAGLRQPRITYYPAIVGFLGFDPSRSVNGAGKSLDAIRRSLGLSIRELARQIGVDEATLYDWERGTRSASPRTQERIAAFLASLSHDSTPC